MSELGWYSSEAKRLIEEAMRGVRIVVCRRCHGLGTVGLESFKIVCPNCRGCGESTINELEVGREAES